VIAGREPELARTRQLLADAMGGRGGALVLRGDAGIGKSTVLQDAIANAGAMTVLDARGVESESELPFAGLHQILRPAFGRLPALPAPQADELRLALGLARGGSVDRFLVSAGVLSLLAEMADDAPVLCAVDDAHWLDVASIEALLFAARRLRAEPIAMIFTTRDGHRLSTAHGLPELRMTGLDAAAAAVLLTGHGTAPAPRDIATRLVQATEGNPFALVELRSVLTAEQLSGAHPLPVPLPISDDLEQAVLAQINELPAATVRLLLAAAAEDTGSVATLSCAADELGIPADALAPAEAGGVITVAGGRLEFRHPLIRSAIQHAADPAERRAVHRALALACADDPDRRAWHRASAAVRPDEDVVADLLGVAARARERAGFAAASRAAERAAELADPAECGHHLLRAATDAWLAGQVDRALEIAGRARGLAVSSALRGELDRLHGTIEFRCGRPAEAFAILVRAARAEPDVEAAARMLAEAAEAASITGHLAGCAEVARLAEALAITPGTGAALWRDLVAGMGRMLNGEPDAAAPLLGRVVRSGRRLTDVEQLAQAGRAAWYLGDEAEAKVLFERSVQLARDRGQLGLLPYALHRLAASEVADGRWASAAAGYEEALSLAHSTGQAEMTGHLLAGLALLAAYRGDQSAFDVAHAEFRRVAEPRGLLLCQDQMAWAAGHLRLLDGHPAEASRTLGTISHPLVVAASVVDRVEAAVRADRSEPAHDLLAGLTAWAAAAGTDRLSATVAHARALLAPPADAERLLRLALDPTTDGRPFDRARAALALGELLRRHGRRVDAREPLAAAVDGFERLGADRWAQRARAELRAAGRSTRRAGEPTHTRLTPQELQVARYAAEGRSSRDVAALLYLSPRTVDFHLRNVFAKLGLTSRAELARLPLDELAGSGSLPVAPARPAATRPAR
jgi:DNA-binding CsgD family transcriptional regulator